MINYLIKTYKSIQKNSLLFVTLLILFLSSCFFFALRINFSEDITQILPKGEQNNKTSKVLQQLNFADKITVMVKSTTSSSLDKAAEVAELFLDTIKRDSIYYSEVQGKVDMNQIDQTFSFVHQNLPYFLNREDYKKLSKKIEKDEIDKQIKNSYKTLISPTGIVAREFILNDPLGFTSLGLNKLKSIGVSKDFIINNGFLSSNDSSTIMLFITPNFSGTDTKKSEVFVDHLYAYQKSLNEQYKGAIEISYFGSPFIALANARQIKSDIQSTVLFSLSILFLILILFYRRILIPITLFVPVICGGLFALAIVSLTTEAISAISISIGAVLLGITIDYSLHIATHYREKSDIASVYKSVTKPILTSSITTSIAFLCLTFVNSKVLQDLGIFASISIVSTAIFALLIIPHLYKPKQRPNVTIIDNLAEHKFHKNKVLLSIAIIAILFGIFSYDKVEFNNNIADLNFVPDEMQASEKQLESLGSIGAKSIYVTAYSDTLESVLNRNNQLEEKLHQLEKEGVIEDYTSIGEFVLSKEKQKEKLRLWNHFWNDQKIDSTIKYVNLAAKKLGFKEDAFSQVDTMLNKKYQHIHLRDYQEIKTLFLDEFYSEKNEFKTLSTIVKTDSISRANVLQTLAKEENIVVIDRKHLNEQFLGEIKDDFKRLMNYSFIAVFIILLFFFRRIELALVSIIPIVLTGIATTTFIYLFGLELNIFSTIVTTLILGLGIDFSIFMTTGLQNKYTNGQNNLKTYRISILLAVLTTVLSIGVLIFAKHPALKSISLISLFGIISAMLITFSIYPIIFSFIFESRPKKGKSPVSLRLFISAVLSHLYYGLGGLLFSLIGIVFIKLLPFNMEFKQRLFRKKISRLLKSVMYTNYGLKNMVYNPHHEAFDKPAIILPNHTSFLDTLSIGFINTPFIFFVNNWVYNSPIFGKAVQLAGYFPITKGLESNEEELIEMVRKGNSLVIFPEGTRSLTNDINRFHKGAFLLAQKYDLDIVPLYIHGNADLLPKGDFIIFDGKHTMEIGERISVNQEYKNLTLRELTKTISKKFKSKFKTIRYKLEDEDYFAQKVKLSFLYKRNEIVKKAKLEFELNKKTYHQVNPHIKPDAKILRIGDDLGIWDIMLTLQEAKRKVFTFIENIENQQIAEQNYLINKRKINYNRDPHSAYETLLITTNVNSEKIEALLNKHEFEQVIIVSSSIYQTDLLKFGFQLEIEENNYSILKKI